MRMRESLKKMTLLKKRNVEQNKEGGYKTVWDKAITIEAIIWDAGGKLQIEMYGERVNKMKNMEYQGTETMKEGDGICICVGEDSDPDYQIISIDTTYTPTKIVLEKR